MAQITTKYYNPQNTRAKRKFNEKPKDVFAEKSSKPRTTAIENKPQSPTQPLTFWQKTISAVKKVWFVPVLIIGAIWYLNKNDKNPKKQKRY